MKAVAVFPASREVRLIERPVPQIERPDQVLLRILEVGICGTDREISAFEYGTLPDEEDYLILGHEALAEVAAVGEHVTQFAPGDLVVPMVRHPCSVPTCRPCQRGQPDFCVSGAFLEHGIKGLHGYMTEFAVVNADYIHLVPPNLRSCAVLTEPLTVAAKGLTQMWHIQERLPWSEPDMTPEHRGWGLKALVLGAGPVGILGAMALRAWGFTTWVYSKGEAPNPRSQLVESIGATYIADTDFPSFEHIAQAIGGVDVIYEAVGFAPVAFGMLRVLGPNGALILTGVPSLGEPRQGDIDRVMRNIVLSNQVILGTVNASANAFREAIYDLDIAERLWPGSLAAIITQRLPIERAPAVLRAHGQGIKQVISFAP